MRTGGGLGSLTQAWAVLACGEMGLSLPPISKRNPRQKLCVFASVMRQVGRWGVSTAAVPSCPCAGKAGPREAVCSQGLILMEGIDPRVPDATSRLWDAVLRMTAA